MVSKLRAGLGDVEYISRAQEVRHHAELFGREYEPKVVSPFVITFNKSQYYRLMKKQDPKKFSDRNRHSFIILLSEAKLIVDKV